MNLKLLTALVW